METPVPSFPLESLSPIAQIIVAVVTTIAGVITYIWAHRDKSSEGRVLPAIVADESERLRKDLSDVLKVHREAIDNRFTQMTEGIRLQLERVNESLEDLKESYNALKESHHHLEVLVARLEERGLKHDRN